MDKEFTAEFFDEASKQWRKNKRQAHPGFFIYTCNYTFKHGKRCGRDCYKDSDLCRQHHAWANKPPPAI